MSQQQALKVSGCTNPTISQINKKENGDTHGTLPSDIAVAIAIEIRMEHGNVNEQRECVGI